MEYFLRTGDILHVDVSVRRGTGIKTGDIVAFFEWAGAPVISAHRVWWKTSPGCGICRLITKGDANLRFDRPVELSQVIGRVASVSRGGGATVSLKGAAAAAAGIFLMIHGVLASSLEFTLRQTARVFLSCAAFLSRILAPFAGRFRFYWLLYAQIQTLADFDSCRALRKIAALMPEWIFYSLARSVTPEAHVFREQSAESPAILAGRVSGDVVVGGEVMVCGDVVVDRGASLTFTAGTILSFSPKKAVNRDVVRICKGNSVSLSDENASCIFVYGCLTADGTPEAPVCLGGGGLKWNGIRLLGESGGVFKNVLFRDSACAVRCADSSSAFFQRCDFSLNGGNAVTCAGVSSVSMADTAIKSAATAIEACEGSRADMRGLVIQDSARGIVLSDAARLSLRESVAGNSGEAGLMIEGPAFAAVSGSIFTGGKTAVLLSERGKLDLDGGAVRNFDCAISLSKHSRIRASGSVFENCRHGIIVNKSRCDLSGCSFSCGEESICCAGGRVTASDCRFNSGRGISLAERSRAEILNSGFENCRCGVIVNRSRCGLSGCSVSCGQEGIGSTASRVTVSDCDFDSGRGIAVEQHSRLRVLKSRFKKCRYGITARGSRCELSECSVNSVEECLSCTGGRVKAAQSEFRSENTGIGLYSASRMVSSGSVITSCDTGMVVNGASRCFSSRDRIVRNRVGMWLQENSSSRCEHSVFRDNSHAGLYLSGGSDCHARNIALARNIIGVFADEESEISVKAGKFRSNRTAFKVDNGSRLKLSDSVVFKSEWDGIWCGGGGRATLSSNLFTGSRYALKEDGRCAVIVRGCVFRNNTSDRFPHG